jgi:superfamily II DNA or RNA helicase
MIQQTLFGGSIPVPTGITGLRPYQEAALQAIRDALARGVRRQLVVMATGLGKGHLLGHVPEIVGARRTLVLAHRVEILDQLAGHMRRASPHYTVAMEQGNRREATPDADVVVASVATLTSPRRRALFAPDQFDLIMHDESHHALADSHVSVLRYFRCHEPDGPLLIGFTATPFRADKGKLANVFDEIVYDKSLRPPPGQQSPIAEGWLCPVRAIRVRTTTDISAVTTHSGDFSAGQLESRVNQADRNDLIASAIHAHAADRHTILVFAVGVDHAYALTARLEADGIETRTVVGTTPDIDRRRIWRDLAGGRVRVVVNVAVATEGFDCPAIDCVVMARPTKSPLLFMQCLGRGMRPHPGKPDGLLVLDVADVCGRHQVQTVSRVFGARDVDLLGQDAEQGAATLARADELGIEVEEGSAISEVEAAIAATEERIREAQRREGDRCSIRLALESDQVNLWSDPVALERSAGFSLFPWFASGRQWVFQVDRGYWAVVERDSMAAWVIRMIQDGRGQTAGENLTTAGAEFPDWVRADAFVKRHAGHWRPPDYRPRNEYDHGIPRWRFICREAARRSRPATEAMVAGLRKWGLTPEPGISYGTASDLLSRLAWGARVAVRQRARRVSWQQSRS